MGFRAMVAAATVAVSVAQAEAASIGTFDVLLTWNAGQYYCEPGPCFDPMPNANDFFPGIDVGETKAATLQIEEMGKAGKYMVSLAVGVHDIVRTSMDSYDRDSFLADTSYLSMMRLLEWDGSSGSYRYANDDVPWAYEVTFSFTAAPAPVPLPAAATLLPLGIGALTMVRRRRRTNN